MNDEVYFWHTEKLRNFLKLMLPFWTCPDMPKVPKIRSLHIYAISPEKHGVEVVLLPADKNESFLQRDSVLDVCN